MSEFMNRTKITALELSNADLVAEISNLTNEIAELKTEIDRLSGKNSEIVELEDEAPAAIDPVEINQLREKIAAYEQRDTEFKALISATNEKIKSPGQRLQAIKHLLSTLRVGDTETVEQALDKYLLKKRAANRAIAFILGILVSLAILAATGHLGDWQSFLSFLK